MNGIIKQQPLWHSFTIFEIHTCQDVILFGLPYCQVVFYGINALQFSYYQKQYSVSFIYSYFLILKMNSLFRQINMKNSNDNTDNSLNEALFDNFPQHTHNDKMSEGQQQVMPCQIEKKIERKKEENRMTPGLLASVLVTMPLNNSMNQEEEWVL